MNTPRSFIFLSLLGAFASCQSNRECSDEVVCETVHRYGVVLEPQDWSARGQYGCVVSMRKDGVTASRNYDAGILHGECTYTFPYRDVVEKKEIYDRGILMQDCSHYPSGIPQRQTVYGNPGCQAITAWYESGAPMCREVIENKNLTSAEYYNEGQEVESSVVDGNGLRTRRDGHGQLMSVDTIQGGQMVLSTTYHPNGIPATLTPYVGGQIEGERRTYLPGGEPATVEIWRDNVQHGETVVFEHGEKRAEIPYVNGYPHGTSRRYRENGQTLVQEENWVQGEKHGPSYSYVGNKTQTDWHFRNRPVPNKATFDMLSNQ